MFKKLLEIGRSALKQAQDTEIRRQIDSTKLATQRRQAQISAVENNKLIDSQENKVQESATDAIKGVSEEDINSLQ